MKLRLKTLAIVGLALLCLNFALFFTASSWLLGDVQTLEQQQIQRDLQRAIDVLSDTASDLDATARDYSEWDATYAFVDDRDPSYLRSNFVDRTFDYLRLNALLIVDRQGQSVFEQGYDLVTRQRTAITPSLRSHLGLDSPLFQHARLTSSVKGIVLLPEGPMMIVSRPIVTSDAMGPSRGTLILGRFLSGQELERLGRLTQLDAKLHAAGDQTAPPEDYRAVESLQSPETDGVAIEPLTGNRLAIYSLLGDIYGRPDLLLRVTLNRDIYAQGEASLRYLLVSLVLVGLVFGAVTLGLLERLVLARLMRLSERVVAVGASGDLSQRVDPLGGQDELAELASTLNTTFDRLEKSQSARLAAEAQFRSIFENAIEGIFRTTLDGKYMSANPAIARIYGYDSPDEMMTELNAADRLYVLPNRRADFIAAISDTGEVTEFESEVYRRDGTRIWISEAARLVRNAQGEPVCYEGTVEDITERKEARVKLERFRDRLQAILEAVPGVVSRVSSDLRYLEVNRHLADSFNLTPEDFVNKDIGFLGYGQEFGQFVADFFASPVQEDSREISRQADDRQEDYLIVAQKYDENRAAFIIGIDISERKAAELALKEAEERYRSIFENAIEGIFQAAPDGHFLRVNPAMARLYGYRSAAELVQAFNRAGGPPYTDPARGPALRSLLQAVGRVSDFVSQIIRPDGRLVWVSENASAVRDDRGKLLYYEGTVEDVTERHLAEERLRERSRLSILEAEIGVTLCQRGDLVDILQSCAELMGGQLACLFVRLWTYSTEGDCLLLQAQTSATPMSQFELDRPLLQDVLRDRIDLVQAGDSLAARVALTRRPQFDHDPAYPAMSLRPLLYFAGYPLVVEERLVGVFALYRDRPISDEIHDVLGWIANAIAVGIDRTQARQELTSRREALLFQLASKIRKSLELPTILQAAVDGIRTLLQTDRCLFAWYCEGDPPTWDTITESRAPDLPSLLGRLPVSLPEENMDLERLVRADDVTRIRDQSLRSLYVNRGYNSVLAILIQTRSGAIGAIECGDCGRLRAWSDREVDLLRAVTDQLAIAIEQSELYSKAQISAMKANEQAKRISEAMAELQRTQTQLIQTEKMSSLGQMVAGVAHEINNPTTFIHGNLTYARNYTQDLLSLLNLYRQHYPEPDEAITKAAQELDVEFLISDLPKTLQSMQIGADRIRQIVASLRNFSRLDQAEMKPVDIHEGIENALLILQHRFKANSNFPGIETLKNYGELPEVVCYAGQLNQVFMNVIANAIDALEERYGRQRRRAPETWVAHSNSHTDLTGYGSGSTTTATTQTPAASRLKPANSGVSSTSATGQPGLAKPGTAILVEPDRPDREDQGVMTDNRIPSTPKLTISTEFVSPDRIRVLIADNGLGMSETVRSKLFDPFFTTKPVGQGTGLGLSICYQIVVEKHRGRLSCRSTPNEGTEFEIEIPVEQPEWSEST